MVVVGDKIQESLLTAHANNRNTNNNSWVEVLPGVVFVIAIVVSVGT